ncbi:MAG TPA: glycosyltransferase [Chthonomonadaceae bacterium]|nr:glycosyltransferase [Chthonomonadaceae bacterium]
MQTFDLIVASHLRWSFVWQRPQQLLSRLARHHRILFVEEPLAVSDTEGAPMPVLQEVMPGVVTLTPKVPESQCNGTPLWLWPCQNLITRQVRDAIRALDLRHRALWFYTPTPEFMVEAVQPEMLVYDVMDELSNFKFAPPQLRDQERRLLSQAAVVFTGGASLYDAKKHHNPNTHLFASGVDAAHYSKAAHPDTTVPEWMEQIPTPRATYIGVIDERMDYDIIRGLAEARPDVQFVMCGPVVKVDPADLPKAPNLHYPGQQAYDDLPRILKGTDVCLMPFAQNEATKFISPTKTLEYMAADRPIISTPIKDVERFYSDIVFLAETPDGFIAHLDAALNEAEEERERKRRRIEKILAEQAWDAIAENMETLMLRAWEKTPTGVRQRLQRSGLPVRSASASASVGLSAPAVETGE